MEILKTNHSKYTLNQRSYLRRGFTVIELLVVMAIISTLGAIGYGVALKMYNNAKINETNVIINAVANAMEARASDITSDQRASVGITDGRTFPDGSGSDTSTTILIEYISGSYDSGVTSKLEQVAIPSSGSNSAEGLFVADVDNDWVIVDAWGTPIRYNSPGNHNTHDNGFDLESAGPDRDFDEVEDNIILE